MTTERDTLTAELIDAGRHLVERGLVQASGGNLSVRLPGSDRFLVTGTGTWLDRLTPDDFAELTLDGERVGGAERPSVEWKLHQRTYAVRPDAACIVHLHPQHVLLVDMLGAAAVHHPGPPVLPRQRRAGALPPLRLAGDRRRGGGGGARARRRGAGPPRLLDLGDTVSMALRRALNLEEAATMTYRLLLAGDRASDFPARWKGNIISV